MVIRRQVGAVLRQLRTDRGQTLREVAEATRVAYSSLSRFETGQTTPDVFKLNVLLEYYDAPVEVREKLRELVYLAKKRDWWLTSHGTASVPEWLVTYIGLEAEAIGLQIYHHLIPGILQTEDYARAVITAGYDNTDATEIDHHVSLRVTRQKQVLESESPPQIHLVLDESALHRQVTDDASVMRRQMGHLARLAKLPNIVVQILPYSRGSYAAAIGSGFVILTYPTEAPSIYLEHYRTGFHLEGEREIDKFRAAFSRLADHAETPDGSARMLTEFNG